VSKKKGLALVKHLIKELSPKDRAQIFPYLAEFPDSGVQSYDLREEIEYLKKHGTILESPPDDPDRFVLGLVFVRNHVLATMYGTPILHATFLPDNFIEAYPKFKGQIADLSERFQNTEHQRETRRANLEAQGIQQTDAEFEEGFKAACDDAATLWMTEKAKRIAEKISFHLPGLVGDMLVAAIKGQTFYDLAEAAKEFGKDIPSVQPIKKAVQDLAWRELKPHLPSTKHVKTHPDWRGEETRKRFAQKVNDRKALATCIKDKYEECDYEPGWTEDLKADATYERLSSGVPQPVIECAIRRAASDISERERQPLSIALEMSRLELGLQEQDIETLHKYYAEGVKLLKADRRSSSSK